MIATASPAWAGVPFGEFLQLLRRNGFAVGLQHYARMMTLLDTLGPDTPPARLRSVLAPVFATTADQQARFYRLFDQWFPVFVTPLPEGASAPATGDAADAPVPTAQSRRGPVKRKRSLLPVWVGLAVIGIAAIGVWVVTRPEPAAVQVDLQPQAVPQPTVPAPAPGIAPTPPATPDESPVQRQVNWQAVRISVALLLVLGFIANEWRHYRRRQMVVERQRRERPPLVWPIRVEAASTPLVESSEFLTAARRLRERQTGERERLDIDATITATIRALGRPVFHYVKETQPPEYLILIERASARDHQARLYLHLIEHLVAEGVHATVYWCEEDPRICDPVIEGPTVTLVELRHKFPAHRLLMFGTGDGLIDPISGRRKSWVSDTLSWPDRALLTPEPLESWGAREVALAGHLMVLPGTLGGLQSAIDHFQLPSRSELARRRHAGTYVPEPNARDAVRAIKSYLGPRGLQWVCACAVYPDLQWNLTLHLGMLPELGGAIDDVVLAKLVRLPWYRQGAIPDEARAVLLRVIDPDVERAARRVIITLLERHPAPPETIASSRFELDLVVQKFALHARTRTHRRELARVARQAPRERVMSELAVLRLTEGDPGSPVAMRLPERMRDIFFHGGVSVLGLTAGARSIVAMALVAGVLFIAPGRASPSAKQGVEVARDSVVPEPASGVASSPALDSTPASQADSVRAVVSAAPNAGRTSDSLSTLPVVPLVSADTSNRNVPPVASERPAPAPAVVRIGSRSPNAELYVGGVLESPIEAVRSVSVAPGEAIRLSIRSAACSNSWDTTVVIAAGDTANLGFRDAACTIVAAPAPATAANAPDPAAEQRLIDAARNEAVRRLNGPWQNLNKAPTVTFGSPGDQTRLAGGIREGNLRGTVRSAGSRVTGGPPVTADSVFLTVDLRFDWRTFVGANQSSDATIDLVFERTSPTPQLRRMHIALRTAR